MIASTPKLYAKPNQVQDNATKTEKEIFDCLLKLHKIEEDIISTNEVYIYIYIYSEVLI